MAMLVMPASDGGAASTDKKRRTRKGRLTPKKQPQRGLGVAQLEKLRLKEQQEQEQERQQQGLLLSLPPSSFPLHSRCDADGAQTMYPLPNGSPCGDMPRVVSAQSCRPLFPTPGTFFGQPWRVGKPSKVSFAAADVTFASSVVTACHVKVYDSVSHEAEERKLGHGEAPNNPVFNFSAVQSLKDGAPATNDSKFRRFFQEVSRNSISSELYTESHGSDLPQLSRNHIEFPVFRVSPNADKSKELPSFQSHLSNQAWHSPDKTSGRKRHWLGIQENDRQLNQTRALDLNAPAGDNETGLGNHEVAITTKDLVSESRVGAHYTTGIIRTALGNNCLPPVKLKATCSPVPHWPDCDNSSSSLYTEPALVLPAYGPLRRISTKGGSLDPEPPLRPQPKFDSNFLTLGMPGGREADESQQGGMSSNSSRPRKRVSRRCSGSGGDEDEDSQTRTSSSTPQESRDINSENSRLIHRTKNISLEDQVRLSPWFTTANSLTFALGETLLPPCEDEHMLDLNLKLSL